MGGGGLAFLALRRLGGGDPGGDGGSERWESTQSWSDVLRDIKRRGLSCPRLVVGDGHLGIWGALRNVYRQAAEQRCWNHKVMNVLDRLPKRRQEEAKLLLRRIPYAPSRTEAERLRTAFTTWCRDRSYEAAAEALERDWDRMITSCR